MALVSVVIVPLYQSVLLEYIYLSECTLAHTKTETYIQRDRQRENAYEECAAQECVQSVCERVCVCVCVCWKGCMCAYVHAGDHQHSVALDHDVKHIARNSQRRFDIRIQSPQVVVLYHLKRHVRMYCMFVLCIRAYPYMFVGCKRGHTRTRTHTNTLTLPRDDET